MRNLLLVGTCSLDLEVPGLGIEILAFTTLTGFFCSIFAVEYLSVCYSQYVSVLLFTTLSFFSTDAHFISSQVNFCRANGAMLCISAAYAVMRCLCVCVCHVRGSCRNE